MLLTVTIRNISTKVVSEIPADLWDKVKNTPMWRGVFEVVKVIKEPPEVTALKARKAAEATGKSKKL